jgi:hypothetical protein
MGWQLVSLAKPLHILGILDEQKRFALVTLKMQPQEPMQPELPNDLRDTPADRNSDVYPFAHLDLQGLRLGTQGLESLDPTTGIRT